jgi:hypothetical protein
VRLAKSLGGQQWYDCSECAKNPAYLTILGHDGPPSPQLWTKNLITDEPLTLCPVRTMLLAPDAQLAEVNRYVDSYFPAYQDGHLLVAGGLADQPARYVELIQVTRRLDRQVQQKFDAMNTESGE